MGECRECGGTFDGYELCQECGTSIPHDHYAELMLDKRRLDWLDLHGEGYGRGWICRLSNTGRGWRLHESSRTDAFKSVRQAIDAALGEKEK